MGTGRDLKRKSANNDEDHEEAIDLAYVAPATRRAGAAAYLRVNMTMFGIEGRVIDGASRLVPSDIFEFDDLVEKLLQEQSISMTISSKPDFPFSTAA
jgi:hypothetical protein